MNENNKLSIIQRYDAYFSGINNKGAFVLALNTLIISGFLIGIKNLKAMVLCQEKSLFDMAVGATILLSLVSMMLAILSIIPYLNSNKTSFWFFNDVANRSIKDFKNQIDAQTDESLKNDINEQIYYLAVGLKKKHFKIRIALILNFIQMLIIGLISYIILF